MGCNSGILSVSLPSSSPVPPLFLPQVPFLYLLVSFDFHDTPSFPFSSSASTHESQGHTLLKGPGSECVGTASHIPSAAVAHGCSFHTKAGTDGMGMAEPNEPLFTKQAAGWIWPEGPTC